MCAGLLGQKGALLFLQPPYPLLQRPLGGCEAQRKSGPLVAAFPQATRITGSLPPFVVRTIPGMMAGRVGIAQLGRILFTVRLRFLSLRFQ